MLNFLFSGSLWIAQKPLKTKELHRRKNRITLKDAPL